MAGLKRNYSPVQTSLSKMNRLQLGNFKAGRIKNDGGKMAAGGGRAYLLLRRFEAIFWKFLHSVFLVFSFCQHSVHISLHNHWFSEKIHSCFYPRASSSLGSKYYFLDWAIFSGDKVARSIWAIFPHG